MTRRLALNLALSVATTVVVLGVLEGTARLFEERQPSPPDVAEYIWDWDDKMPGGFYVMRSEAVGWPPWEPFNRDGLRDRTRPREKLPDVWRVAVLCDSVTLGDGIRRELAFPQVMESQMEGEGRRVEVMNVALWGWSTRQERIAWERIARRYRPDQVLLAVCLNDIPELHNNLARPPRWLATLYSHSALVRLVVGGEGREIDRVERLFAEADSPRVRGAMRRFFDEVRELRREVETAGAAFGIVVFPFRFQLEPSAPPPVAQERIAAFCGGEGIHCLDLLPTFRRAGSSVFLDYDHLSPRGAILTADTLLASGLLPEGYSHRETLRAHFAARRERGARTVLAWLGAREGPLPREGLAAVLEALEAEEGTVRAAAAWALGTVEAPSAPVVDALAGRLRRDAVPMARVAAARALAGAGEASRPLVPALFEALGDDSETVRHAAARALARLGPRDLDVSLLASALDSEDAYVRGFAAWSLGNLGPSAREAVPKLIEALQHDDTERVVATALARIGPAAAEAVPALAQALHEADAGRRWRAARALGRIGPPAASAAEALTAALRDPDVGVRLHAARALGRIGPGARTAAAALQRATGDRSEAVRREARQALDRLH